MTQAIWTNGKRQLKGSWEYQWAAQRSFILLNSRDHITGERRYIISDHDTPEWGNWKLVRPISV